MRRVCLPLLLILLVTSIATSQSTADKSAEQEIRRLHQAQRKALLDRDTAALERIFSPDFVVTNPFGEFLTARQVIGRVGNGEIDFESFDRHIDYVKVYGDTAIAAGRETFVPKGKMTGAGKVMNLRITTVWIRRDGRWQEIARHTSVQAPPAASAPPAKSRP